MPKITTFLTYDNQAEAAVNHYVSVFENSRVTNTTRYGEGMPGEAGSVLTMAFELDGQPFVAMNGGPHFKLTDAISLSVACGSQAEVDQYWAHLAEGGEEGPCGWLKDRFGLSWQIVPDRLIELMNDPDQAKAQRVTEAMLQMKKIVIADLEAAYAAG